MKTSSRKRMIFGFHSILLAMEIGSLVAIIWILICKHMPLADRCYEESPSVLRYRLSKGQDDLVRNITQCRVYCSTKQFQAMGDNTNVVVNLDKAHPYEEVTVPLPAGLLNFRIDFYYYQTRKLPVHPPALDMIALNDEEINRKWLHGLQIEKIRAVCWLFIKDPPLKGHLVDLVLSMVGACFITVVVLLIILKRTEKTNGAD